MAKIKLLTGLPVYDPCHALSTALAGAVAPPQNGRFEVGTRPGYTVVFKGDFHVSGGTIAGGHVKSFAVYAGDTKVMSGSGYAVDAAALYDAAGEFAFDEEEYLALMVDVRTTYVGTSKDDHLVSELAGGSKADKMLGKDGNDMLAAFGGADILKGGDGNDVLDGGPGRDELTGGRGKDVFAFTMNFADPRGDGDKIADFRHGQDTIGLFDIAGGLRPGVLSKSYFHAGKHAGDGNDIVVYDKKSGKIFFDPDGSDSDHQVLLAKVKAGTKLHAGDFFVTSYMLLH